MSVGGGAPSVMISMMPDVHHFTAVTMDLDVKTVYMGKMLVFCVLVSHSEAYTACENAMFKNVLTAIN